MGEPEVDDGDVIVVVEAAQVLSSHFLHEVVVGVDVFAILSEKQAHGTFPLVNE